jgi:hypothetical protein
MVNKIGHVAAALLGLFLFAGAVPARAQGIEFTPMGGYRFGGDLFEDAAGRPLDIDGAPALGAVLDIPLWEGLQFEGLFSHQQADVLVPVGYLDALQRWRLTVDHWQGGALQEFSDGEVRPFLTGTLGLTRYAAEGDNEIRFTLGAGGGVKLFPVSRVGVRLDGRVFTTFVDAGGSGFACVYGTCFIALNVDIAWQAEFTAGLIVRLP